MNDQFRIPSVALRSFGLRSFDADFGDVISIIMVLITGSSPK